MDGPWVKGSSNYLGIRHGWSESVAPPVAVPLVADPVWPGVSRSSLMEVGLGAHRVGSDLWGVPACALGPRDAPRAARVRPSSRSRAEPVTYPAVLWTVWLLLAQKR